ncbi:MAG: hypothetical protein ACI9OJ_003110 [Myxococcota bacterium]
MKPKTPYLTDEFVAKLRGALIERHAIHLRAGENFHTIDGEAGTDAWSLMVVFQNEDRSLYLPVEAAIVAVDNPEVKPQEARDLLADFIDYYFGEYFKGHREITLPLDWLPLTFGEFHLRVRGWEKNKALEDMADRLLAGEFVD